LPPSASSPAGFRFHLHVGSLAIKLPGERAANRSFLIDRDGEIVARYEQDHIVRRRSGERGEAIASRAFPARGACGHGRSAVGRLGLTICYDLRFAALYRALAESGSAMLAIPSAFTRQTGEGALAHIGAGTRDRERLLRFGRQPKVAAHENGRETYGHSPSSILGPHPRRGGLEPGIGSAEIDLAAVATARRRVPSPAARAPVRHDRAGVGAASLPRGREPR